MLQLFKIIYGSKQSSYKQYKKLTAASTTLGFTALEKDHAVFRLIQGADIIILAIHIDDCTITGSSFALINIVQECFAQLFQVTLLSPISWLLDMEIIYNQVRREISLNQTLYINFVLQCFNTVNCKPLAIPMDPSANLSCNQCPTNSNKIAEMQCYPYYKLVGLLI